MSLVRQGFRLAVALGTGEVAPHWHDSPETLPLFEVWLPGGLGFYSHTALVTGVVGQVKEGSSRKFNPISTKGSQIPAGWAGCKILGGGWAGWAGWQGQKKIPPFSVLE